MVPSTLVAVWPQGIKQRPSPLLFLPIDHHYCSLGAHPFFFWRLYTILAHTKLLSPPKPLHATCVIGCFCELKCKTFPSIPMRSGSQVRMILSPGDIWQCRGTFLIVITGSEGGGGFATGIWWEGAQVAPEHLPVGRTACTAKNPPQTSLVWDLRSPAWCNGGACALRKQQQLLEVLWALVALFSCVMSALAGLPKELRLAVVLVSISHFLNLQLFQKRKWFVYLGFSCWLFSELRKVW